MPLNAGEFSNESRIPMVKALFRVKPTLD
jgi:hypothetical protein